MEALKRDVAELHEQGLSQRVIAGKLGTSGTKVSRVCRALGIARPATQSDLYVRKPQLKKERKRARVSVPRPPPRQEPVPFAAAPPLMLSILELTDSTCRWPIGEPGKPGFAFCGHMIEPSRPYCPGHYSRAWRLK